MGGLSQSRLICQALILLYKTEYGQILKKEGISDVD
jgi:hypothetical protein